MLEPREPFKYCENCKKEGVHEYYDFLEKFYKYNICPKCGHKLTHITEINVKDCITIRSYLINFPFENMNITTSWRENWRDNALFIDQMIKLHEEDIIKYKEKIMELERCIQQRRVEFDKYIEEKYGNKCKCPTCGSTNVEKISLTSKAVGGAFFGLFSSNVRNTFRCNDCGYKW